jgi:diguanylate cyclase (GGDEF)-like protein
MLMRAPRRLFALLVLVCVLAGCQHSQERTVSLSEIVKSDATSRGQRVSATAIVTYGDPDWRMLFVQDQSSGIYIEAPHGSDFEAGDRVQITGTLSLGQALDHAKISILSKNNPLPPPLPVSDYAALPASFSQFVEVEGTVRWTGLKNGRAVVQVSSSGKPLVAYLHHAAVEDLPAYGSEVHIAGVAAADADSHGQFRGPKLFSPSAQYIKVLKPGPADPFSLPLRELSDLKSMQAGKLVHISGRILRAETGFSITDGKRFVPIALQQEMPDISGASDVAGFWTGRGLDDVTARPMSTQIARAGDIVHLADLKHLSAARASTSRRVSVRAVVTYIDPAWGLLFVQDDTDATYVDFHQLQIRLHPGDLVDISGLSDAGGFAPIIVEPSVGFVRKAQLPVPVRIELLQGNLDGADSKWSSFRGVVHTAREQDGHTILKMAAGQTELNIQLPTLVHGAGLIDKEVSATGVLGVLFNDRRQAIGHQLFVPSPAFLTSIDSPPAQAVPATIDSLRRYSPDTDERHSVIVNGTVVLKSAADTIFVQDRTAGIEIRGLGPLRVSSGDRVTARGFMVAGEYSPVLEDAVVTVTSSGSPMQAHPLTAKTAMEGHYDSEYVSIRGRVAAVRSSANGTILILNDKGTLFEAFGPSSGEFDSLRVGSEIEIRGVCRIAVDRNRSLSVSGFSLAFDSPRAISVIKMGPWWDASKITSALFLLAAIAVAIFLWAVLLRRKVDARTRELQSSVRAKRRAQQFDIARNQVLEAIARNAPPPESMEFLARAVQEQIEGSICAIAMSPDGNSFLNGKPSALLIAPDLPEELHREILPALSSVLVGSPESEDSVGDDTDIMASLLDAANHAGLDFQGGELVIAFSGGGELAGLLMIFFRDTSSTDADTATRVLQSASRLVSLARDHWHMHERLVFDARHDALTGLPNRTLAEDRLEQALARAQRRKQLFAVVCIDLDGFKGINDNLGHHAGDELLQVIAVRLRARIRHSDTLARIGGDEFLAIIEDCSDDAAAQSVADSLISALQEPIAIEGTTVAISGSIGIAMYPADGKQASELERSADQAMYRAKAHGGGQTCFWSGEPASTGRRAVTKSSSSS